MIHIIRALSIFPFVLSSLAIPLAKRTVIQVETDITELSNRVTALRSVVQAFPSSGGSLASALTIHTDASNLARAIRTATSDTENTDPFSETDGQTILTQAQALAPNIVATLQDLVDKKAAFASLPIGGASALVKQDLQDLASDASAFENALIAKAPTDLSGEANGIKSSIDGAFASALVSYSS